MSTLKQLLETHSSYHKDTEPLYHSIMYSLVSLLSGIYPLPSKHSLLVTLYLSDVFLSVEVRRYSAYLTFISKF